MKLSIPLTLASVALAGYAFAVAKNSPSTSMTETTEQAKPTIVLVHGAFADGSCWSKIVPLLQKDGYTVTAVQNPMTSYADDVATTRRAIDAIKGPVVLVGHSYGGAVISGAGTGAKNVKSLVYVAAFGPDENETILGMLQKYPSPLASALVPDAAGFVSIDLEKYPEVFTGDLPLDESKALAVMQGPIKGEIIGTPMPVPAWKTIPSWYMVAQEDKAINPELERLYAKRMNAKTIEVKASHVPFLSKPVDVVKLIEEAAK